MKSTKANKNAIFNLEIKLENSTSVCDTPIRGKNIILVFKNKKTKKNSKSLVLSALNFVTFFFCCVFVPLILESLTIFNL